MVRFVPVPFIEPGFNVQFPEGRLPKITLPVAISQVGCVIRLAVGADGGTGCGFITILAVATEVHPAALVTV